METIVSKLSWQTILRYWGRFAASASCTLFAGGLLCAQNVPPPPKPQPDGPSLASILESLKQTLLASGSLNYTQDQANWRFTITDVTVDATECSMRVNSVRSVLRESPQEFPSSTSYFFESIDSAEMMTLQESWDRGHREDTAKSRLSAGYATVINGNGWGLLLFADRNAAIQVADLLRRTSETAGPSPFS